VSDVATTAWVNVWGAPDLTTINTTLADLLEDQLPATVSVNEDESVTQRGFDGPPFWVEVWAPTLEAERTIALKLYEALSERTPWRLELTVDDGLVLDERPAQLSPA
jgi:hypothetical protein